MPFEYQASGTLELKGPITLTELEEFCKEARRYGVGENAPLHTSRQGLVGAIQGWYFFVPVAPKIYVKE